MGPLPRAWVLQKYLGVEGCVWETDNNPAGLLNLDLYGTKDILLNSVLPQPLTGAP